MCTRRHAYSYRGYSISHRKLENRKCPRKNTADNGSASRCSFHSYKIHAVRSSLEDDIQLPPWWFKVFLRTATRLQQGRHWLCRKADPPPPASKFCKSCKCTEMVQKVVFSGLFEFQNTISFKFYGSKIVPLPAVYRFNILQKHKFSNTNIMLPFFYQDNLLGVKMNEWVKWSKSHTDSWRRRSIGWPFRRNFRQIFTSFFRDLTWDLQYQCIFHDRLGLEIQKPQSIVMLGIQQQLCISW